MIRAWCPNCDVEIEPHVDGSCPACDADTDRPNRAERRAMAKAKGNASHAAQILAERAGTRTGQRPAVVVVR